MLKRLGSNPSIKHFTAYSLSFIAYGFVITGLGPLIPYLAEQAGRFQTDYSSLFFFRAVAFIISGFLVKKLHKIVSLHQMLIWSSILSCIFLTLFCYAKTTFAQNLAIMLASIACSILEIGVNISVIMSHAGHDQQFWLQLNHSVFGIGGLTGPIIVYIFETDSFMIMGACIAVTAVPYLFLESPEIMMNNEENTQNQKDQKEQKTRKPISTKIEIILCIIFLLYVGLQHSFGGWISTYAVIQGISSKSQATAFSSIFWISITAFRFILAFIPGKISTKLKICIWTSLAVTIITLFLINSGFQYAAILISSIILGAIYAPMFPLQFSSPYEYKMELTVSQSSTLMIAASMGQATISMFIGYLMGIFSPDMLFYSLIVVSFMYIFAVGKMDDAYIELSEKYKENLLDDQFVELKQVRFAKKESEDQKSTNSSPVIRQK